MKSFLLSSFAAALASAAITKEFVEGAGENGTSGQFVRISDSTSHVYEMIYK